MTKEFEPLLQRYLDGGISAEEMKVLNSALEADGALRREFVDLLDLDASLGAMARQRETDEDRELIRPDFRSGFRPGWKGFVALAASVVVAAVFLWAWQGGSTQSFALVEESTGAKGPAIGLHLKGERIELAEGTVKLRTRPGAELVIEAPAAFRFESPHRLRLEQGRLAADVPPPATGFTVVTPDGEAVDLGTRFGIDVTDRGQSEIHVFEGEVVAHPSGPGDPTSLRGGEAYAMRGIEGGGRELRNAAFIEGDEMSALRAALEAGQRPRAVAATAALRRDAALIALLDFEDGKPDSGVCRSVQGRWPGSRALEFVEAGDHLALDLGGGRDWPQLTLAAWVRLDRLGAPYQSLFHTDGWSGDLPGQVHWMINGDATMRFALRDNLLAPGSDEAFGHPDSRTPVLAERGRWVHLAVTYDADAGVVRFFLNGRFDKETRLALAHPARLGPARIGNWDQQDRKLSGRVDELVLIGRTLADSEIAELFEAGKPYLPSE